MTTATLTTRPFPAPFVLPPVGAPRVEVAAPRRARPAQTSRETDEALDAPAAPAILFGALAGGYALALTAGWLAFVQAVPLV